MPSGKGQDRPAPSTRFNVSRTVERARPSRRAISCVDTDEDFSRIISRASRIPIRSAGIDPPLGLPKGRPDQANGSARQSTKDPGGIIPLWGARSSRNRGAASFRYRRAASFRYRRAASSRNWGAASSGISNLAAILRDFLPPGRQRRIGAPDQFVRDLLEESLYALRFDSLEGHPVTFPEPHRSFWPAHTPRVAFPACSFPDATIEKPWLKAEYDPGL